MSEDAPRNLKSMTVDGQSMMYLSPQEQAVEDRRQAERQGLKRANPLSNFFRIFKISTRDR